MNLRPADPILAAQAARTWPFTAGVYRKPMREILSDVAASNGLTVADIRGPARQRHIAHPRQEFMWRARQWGFTYSQIARVIHRDHTTVIHGERAFAARAGAKLSTGPAFPVHKVQCRRGDAAQISDTAAQ